MSQEHQPKPSESHERSLANELAEIAKENATENKGEILTPEAAEKDATERAERAREVLNKHETQPEPPAETESVAEPPSSFAARLDQVLNYHDTLASIQRKLSPASRSFSRVIHAPAIEKASEVMEGTVMRPSLVTGATWTAFLVGLIFYLTARYYGFALSGSEMLAALMGGAILGLVLEGVARVIRRRRRS
ncbi:MAG TPA: hypothetical protein VLI05_00215 [Candidatus Saccharimonadia bacterium]|nr:hypothetical protein [Candidatus Saccharimonadia bacterium]